MTLQFATLLIVLSAVLTGIGVGLMRRFALSRAILDVPNERSSIMPLRAAVWPLEACIP